MRPKYPDPHFSSSGVQGAMGGPIVSPFTVVEPAPDGPAGSPPPAGGNGAAVEAGIHPAATIDPEARIGRGAAIGEGVRIGPGAQLGEDCAIGREATIASGVRIGDRTVVGERARICAAVIIGDGVLISDGVAFSAGDALRAATADLSRRLDAPPDNGPSIWVHQGATIGVGALIGGGVEIGSFAMVSLGAVVTRPVQPFHMAGGNPARPSGTVCRCGQTTMKFETADLRSINEVVQCRSCGMRYQVQGGWVREYSTV